MPSAITYKSRA